MCRKCNSKVDAIQKQMGKVSVDVGLLKKQNVSTRCDVFKLVTGIYGPHMEPSHLKLVVQLVVPVVDSDTIEKSF